jgi:hypothetical protein
MPIPLNAKTDYCLYLLAAEEHAAKPEAGAIDPLDGVNPAFRAASGWNRLGNLRGAANVYIFMCRPVPEIAAGADHRFVAFDPATYRGEAVTDTKALQQHWNHQLNGRPFSMPFLKSGLVIFKKLGIKVTPETTAYMMQMESVDVETSDAIQSAILNTYNSSSYPVDIESLVFVLACFIHADPLRKHLVSQEPYAEPYGDATQYGLKKINGEGGGNDGQ